MTSEEKEAVSLVVELTITRLTRTYKDYIENVKGFEEVPDFFRNHLYSPSDKEARDIALESLYEKLKNTIGESMSENIHKLILLTQLTDELDLYTSRELLNGPLNGSDNIQDTEISEEEFNNALLTVGRLPDRIKQILMIVETLRFFYSLSRLPMFKLVMAPIKVAAAITGARKLVETIEAGYALSKKIDDLEPFLEVFIERENDNIQSILKSVSISGE